MVFYFYMWSIYSNLWKREFAAFLLGVSNFLLTYFLLDFKQHLKLCLLTCSIIFSFCLLLFTTTNHKYLKIVLTVLHMTSLYFLILNVYQAPIYLVEYEFLPTKNENSTYKYSIFFLESNHLRRELTTRQVCAVESAAKNNPRALVQLYSISARLNKNMAKNLNEKYPNLRFINFEPEKVFSDTPFLSWWHNGTVLKSKFRFFDLAIAFRLAILWKYGGVYSSLELIMLKSFESLINSGKNGFGYILDGDNCFSLDMLVFDAKNPLLDFLVHQFVRSYNSNEWSANNRHKWFRKMVSKYCLINDDICMHLSSDYIQTNAALFSTKMADSIVANKCTDLAIYPEEYFLDLGYSRKRHILNMLNKNLTFKDENLLQVNNTYSLDKLKANRHLKVGNNTINALLSSKECDVILKYVTDNFLKF